MDVHIYRSEAKDPADLVRVEVRPREGVARRYDPLEFLDLAKGHIYKVRGAAMGAVEADSNRLSA